MWTTEFIYPAESEISVIQGHQISELFFKSIIYSDLGIPAVFHLTFVSLLEK